MHISDIGLDITKLLQLEKDGFIVKRKHPTEELYILNYTSKTQYDRAWTPETLVCRGLIIDNYYNVIARPFPKFFNLGEHEGDLPNGEFEVLDKLDGSLGIMYRINNMPYIASRGSFDSEQAIAGTKMIQAMYTRYELEGFSLESTYLFEIIYPQNRIVIDYGGRKELVLLARLDTVSGRDLAIDIYHPNVKLAERYSGVKDITKLAESNEQGREGYVIRWLDTDYRLKVKFEDYLRLHKLLTGVSSRTVWELLRNGESTREFVEKVPDEFHKWFTDCCFELRRAYATIECRTKIGRNKALKLSTRKERAAFVMKEYKDVSGIIFRMIDEKEYNSSIWKMVRPKESSVFKCEGLSN